MENLEKFKRILFGRIIFSVFAYGIFIALGAAYVMTGNDALQLWVPVPLVIAVFALPRHITPRGEDISVDEETGNKLIRTRKWLTYVRIAYFLLAIVVMLGLPELLGPR